MAERLADLQNGSGQGVYTPTNKLIIHQSLVTLHKKSASGAVARRGRSPNTAEESQSNMSQWALA